MSFMFNPYPYDDPKPVNHVSLPTSVTNQFVYGNKEVGQTISEAVKAVVAKKKACIVAVDGYPGADFAKFNAMFKGYELVDVKKVFKSTEEINKILEYYLPIEPDWDATCLYGKLYKDGYKGLFDSNKLQALCGKLADFKKNGKGVMLVYGLGALEETIRQYVDVKVWIDVIPMYSVLNCKRGNYINIGETEKLPFKASMRRSYYVDYECSIGVRRQVIDNSQLTFWLDGNRPDSFMLCPMKALDKVFDAVAARPYRCKPVYCEGIWGGSFIKRIRHLPDEMVNCAWVFDLIPSEVSLVAEANGKRIEFPYYSFLHARCNKVMGDKCVEQWHGYCPIRYNYDDTWHSSGNMSIQCHPDEDYVKKNNHELGRQDESYYVVEAGEGARTFIGFKDGCNPDTFMKLIKKSEKTKKEIPYLDYVGYIESKPGTQIMLPAGTLHSSGRNQLILEGGTLTIGSYTYKLYDYMRKDLDGTPRPIFCKHGDKVIQKHRDTTWCKQNIIGYARPKEYYEDVLTQRIGHHDLMYFDCWTTQFETKYEDKTNGTFAVIVLVNGDSCKVYSKKDPKLCYNMDYLDMVIVPSTVEDFVVENTGNLPATIHKTCLKPGFEHQLDTYYSARKIYGKK